MIRRWLRRRILGRPTRAAADRAPEEFEARPWFLAEELQSVGPHHEWALARLDANNAGTVLPHALPYLVHSRAVLVELAHERIEPLVLPRLARVWLNQLPTLARLVAENTSERLARLLSSVERMLQAGWNAGMLAEGERSEDRDVRRHAWRLGLARRPLDPELAEAAFGEEQVVRTELFEVVQGDVDWLRRFLVDPSRHLRRSAFDGIVDLRPVGWREDLQRILLDDDRSLREAAAYELRREGEDPVSLVAEALEERTAERTLRPLEEVAPPPPLRLVERQPDARAQDPASGPAGQGELAALERALRAPAGELKRVALDLLGAHAERLGLPRLLELADDDADARAGLRRVAQHLQPAAAVAVLLRSLAPAGEGERRELRALVEHHAQRLEALPGRLSAAEVCGLKAEVAASRAHLPADQIRRLGALIDR